MKQICLTFLVFVAITYVAASQTANLVLNTPESGNQLHQATNSITLAIGYSYTPAGGTMTAEILKSGETMEMPIVAGQFSNSFTYIDTRNTADFANNFTGKTTNDVFYKFTLANRMSVIITHCGSVISDTYMTLLDANGLPTESNDNYSGDGHCANTYQSFIRRDLEAGTYYIVSEGNYSNGEITTTITGYFDEFNYSDIPDYYSTESGTVGETPGELSVSETGASAVTIPIDFPAGVGGMQPSLAIVYNSQAANGIAGWGANIAGISAITRTPKSIYYDGTAKGLTYLGDDAYLWDGKRLIYSTGTAGQEGAEYYPESDPFTKITVHGTYSGSVCSTWFEVQANDGMKYIYGNTSAFRQTLPSGKVTAWYLSKVEDPLGKLHGVQLYDQFILHISECHFVWQEQQPSGLV